MTEAIIITESIALFLVYSLILVATYKSPGIDRYFLALIGSLALSASWLLITELSLVADFITQIADRTIRPTVNRGIQLLGAMYFLYGCFWAKRE